MRDYAALACALALPVLTHADGTFRDCAHCPAMREIPGGSFEMGYLTSETNPETDANPVRLVTIDREFAVSANEITVQQFAEFVTATAYQTKDECNVYDTEWWYVKDGISWSDPGFEQKPTEPVVCVSWLDAKQYTTWLSGVTGKDYRLPTEAEWEYVARNRGIEGQLDGISHDSANFGAVECCGPKQSGNDRWDRTAPVGSFPADELGLYDIRGNVWEWLEDCYHDNYNGAPDNGTARESGCSAADNRVVRGGSYGDDIFFLRAGYRLRAPADNGYFTLGFRVARALD